MEFRPADEEGCWEGERLEDDVGAKGLRVAAFTVGVTKSGVAVPPLLGVGVERKKEGEGGGVGVMIPEAVPPPPP